MPLPLPKMPQPQDHIALPARDLHHFETEQAGIAALHARIEASFALSNGFETIPHNLEDRLEIMVQNLSRAIGPIALVGAIAALAFAVF